MIESTSNTRLKRIQRLRMNARFRRQEQAFVVEGWKLVGEALTHRLAESVYLSEGSLEEYRERVDQGSFLQPETGVDIQIVSDPCFRQISDTVNPQGILAIVQMPQYDREVILDSDRAAVLCLEDIQDPGNLGTMLRTAEGAGMSAVILSKGCVDLFNPKVVRSTMGALFRVPYLICHDMSTEVEYLKSGGFTMYAAHLKGRHDFTQEEYKGKVGILIGNEAKGLTDSVSEQADRLVRIPMEGQLESLNAAVSAALLMYEVHRHRRESGDGADGLNIDGI